MSFPPRGPPMGMPPMFMGMPPSMGIPPPMMPPGGNHPQGHGGMQFFGGPMRPGGPPPLMRPNMMHHNQSTITKPPVSLTDDKPADHPQPLPQPSGPPVTVFVGNITEKWPDAMIRQLLATCGQVINWKRVQGASGKLQGFGFCEFNGPDAGLRAVRLLHGLEVGDKKLVVKVDAKTSSVLEEFKAERKKKKIAGDALEVTNGNGTTDEKKTEDGEIPDYMDQEMKEADERSSQRISIIFREFKNEIESYIPPGSEKAKAEKDASANKQQIQEKLHLLKLSSLDTSVIKPEIEEEPDLPEDLANDEGKREIITREITIFRESMKAEKQREEERKKQGRERREKEREREERKRNREKGTEDINSPDHFRDRDRFSPRRDRDKRDRSRDRGGSRDNRRDRRRDDRDDRNRRDRDRDRERDRRRRTSRDRRSKSRSVERILRSPPPTGSSVGPKPRYREREEEEEQVDQKRLERKAREKEAAYEERLREWELREAQKAREYKKLRDRQKRQEDDVQKEAKRMKQFLEDYDDEKHDGKYYRGKDLQKRLAERARELEDDNKDRQKEREELEEMKLRMLTSNSRLTPSTSTPNILLEKYKRPPMDSAVSTPSPTTPLFSGLKMELKPSINSRLQAIANNQQQQSSSAVPPVTHHTVNNHVNSDAKNKDITIIPQQPTTPTPEPQKTSFNSIQFNSFVPLKSTSNPSTPNSLVSPAQPMKLMKPTQSPEFFSDLNSSSVNNSSPIKMDDDNSRQSFSSAPSPGMPSTSPQNFNREGDDSSLQSPLDAPKRKKIDVKDVFNQDEDDDGFGLARKRKLVPLDFGDEANKKLKKDDNKNPEEKKKHIKALIDKIPTDKDALFEYEIDWEMVDTSLMEKRIRPWINKKIVEYIGEPEPTLVDFICSKVLGRSAPRSILDDVVMVLDEEAEVFVVKMWRLLVYEIEAKKYGLAGGKAPA